MSTSTISGPVDAFRPVYGDGRLFLLGFVLGVALGVPTWLAVVAGHAVIHQVPRDNPVATAALLPR